jgi:hypothetical protein
MASGSRVLRPGSTACRECPGWGPDLSQRQTQTQQQVQMRGFFASLRRGVKGYAELAG